MKYFYSLFLVILNFFNCYSQSKDLTGKWIMVKTMFNNGKNLDLSDAQYSTKQIFEIKENAIKISNFPFAAQFTKNQIKTSFRTLNYLLKDNYLIIQEDKDDKSSYYLKADDFVKKFPEFSLKEIERDGAAILVDNSLTGYEFNNELSLDDFIDKNIIVRNSKDFKNLNFQIEFILTTNNQIKNIKVLNSIDELYDNQYIMALKRATRYFNNLSGKDLLIFKEVNQLKWENDLADKEERKLYPSSGIGLKYFYTKKYDKVIIELSKIKALKIEQNQFKTIIKESMIKLGISYLATGKINEACQTFNEVGDKTDFEIRNYLLDFCEKK